MLYSHIYSDKRAWAMGYCTLVNHDWRTGLNFWVSLAICYNKNLMRKDEIDVIYFRRLKLHGSRLKTYIDSMEIKSACRTNELYREFGFCHRYRHRDVTIKCPSKWLPQWTTFHVIRRGIFNTRPSFERVKRKALVKNWRFTCLSF